MSKSLFQLWYQKFDYDAERPRLLAHEKFQHFNCSVLQNFNIFQKKNSSIFLLTNCWKNRSNVHESSKKIDSFQSEIAVTSQANITEAQCSFCKIETAIPIHSTWQCQLQYMRRQAPQTRFFTNIWIMAAVFHLHDHRKITHMSKFFAFASLSKVFKETQRNSLAFFNYTKIARHRLVRIVFLGYLSKFKKSPLIFSNSHT